jgi:hypothetical protein
VLLNGITLKGMVAIRTLNVSTFFLIHLGNFWVASHIKYCPRIFLLFSTP